MYKLESIGKYHRLRGCHVGLGYVLVTQWRMFLNLVIFSMVLLSIVPKYWMDILMLLTTFRETP
jgi:hypothetical protein